MNPYLDGMSRYFDFSGRSSRWQFWIFVLVADLLIPIMLEVGGRMLGGRAPQLDVISMIVVALHWIPFFAVLTRRLHDTGRHMKWILWLFLPIIGWVIVLVVACQPSQDGENDYGPDPRVKRSTAAGPQRNAIAVEPTMSPPVSALPVEQLEKLQALRASGAIDEAEFAAMKSRLLAGMTK